MILGKLQLAFSELLDETGKELVLSLDGDLGMVQHAYKHPG